MNSKKTKINWMSGLSWTVLVTAITCTIFASMLLSAFYLGGIFDPDTGAVDVSQSVNRRVDTLAAEVKALREHNMEMAKYLEVWTPLKCRKELGIKEKWIIPGLGLPEVIQQSYSSLDAEFVCE